MLALRGAGSISLGMTRIAQAVLIAAVVFTLAMALKPADPMMPGAELDKLQHIAAFFTLAVLSRLAFPRAAGAVLFVALAVLGALIEVAQLTPGLHRHGDVADFLVDIIAAAAGLLVASALQRIAARG
jgi:VanZ family protein